MTTVPRRVDALVCCSDDRVFRELLAVPHWQARRIAHVAEAVATPDATTVLVVQLDADLRLSSTSDAREADTLALGSRTLDRVFLDVESWVPFSVTPFLAACVSHMFSGPNVATMARACACSTRTLQRECERVGLPQPAVLVSWVRALSIAFIVEGSLASQAAISRSFGFSSPRALRRLLRRHGTSVVELRAAGSYRRLFARFATSMARGKAQAEKRPRN